MGSRNSSRRRQTGNMRHGDDHDEQHEEEGESGTPNRTGDDRTGSDSGARASGADLATILQYLINSGQVRVVRSGDTFDYSDEDDDEDLEFEPTVPPMEDAAPDTSLLEKSSLRQEILLQSGQIQSKVLPIPNLLQRRELGRASKQTFSSGDLCSLRSTFLPNTMHKVARYRQKAFCGTYSADGNVFLSACQDRCLRVYDTRYDGFKEIKCISARDVGWSVLDTAFSPDGNFLIYSSWSDCIHLCNIYGDYDIHEALHLRPGTEHSFCVFSLMFSQNNTEILGGANDGNLYVYDRERQDRVLKIDAHEDDVNAVCFADASSQILYSGGDDGLVKVWDRRTLSEELPKPVGILAGHADGIIFIDTKGDARHLISNSKDQTVKLWDIRHFATDSAIERTKQEVRNQHWDYRWQSAPKRVIKKNKRLQGDTSLMTYRGHSVRHTLIRCRFSPLHQTGQRYIYSGCGNGNIVVYDLLTGKVETRLKGHKLCVRDVSWHPYENKIMSTSWDGSVGLWQYKSSECEIKTEKPSRPEPPPRRRSNRLAARYMDYSDDDWP